MKHIVRFNQAQDANNYEIKNIPFITLVGENNQLLSCNEEDKMIVVDGQGNVSVEDAPNLIHFNIKSYVDQPYAYIDPEYYDDYSEYSAEPGSTFAEFVDSEYNLPMKENFGKHCKCKIDSGRDGNAIYFGEDDVDNLPFDEDFRYNDPAELLAGNNIVLEDGKTYYYWDQPYCLLSDTEITMADGSLKQIKDIVVGDEVLSLDLETGEQVIRKVIFTDAAENKSTTVWDEWIFSDGTILKTAHRHEFFNVDANKFKYMDEWQVGEHTLKQDGSTPKLVKHNVHEEVVNHYKITLENSNNYFANGCLTGDRYCNEKNIKVFKAH